MHSRLYIATDTLAVQITFFQKKDSDVDASHSLCAASGRPGSPGRGIEIAQRRKEALVVVNASPGGQHEDPSKVDVQDVERVEDLLAASGLDATSAIFPITILTPASRKTCGI